MTTWAWILNPNAKMENNCEKKGRNSLSVLAKNKTGLCATHHRHWHWHGRHRHHGRHGHRWHHRPRSLVIFTCYHFSATGNSGNGGTPQCLAAVAPGRAVVLSWYVSFANKNCSQKDRRTTKNTQRSLFEPCDPSHSTFICSPSVYLWWWHHGFVLDNTCHSTVYLKFWRWGVIIVGTWSIILIILDKYMAIMRSTKGHEISFIAFVN